MQLVVDKEPIDEINALYGDIVTIGGQGNYIIININAEAVLMSLSGSTFYGKYGNLVKLNKALNNMVRDGKKVEHYTHHDFQLKLDKIPKDKSDGFA